MGVVPLIPVSNRADIAAPMRVMRKRFISGPEHLGMFGT
jgi:hypothetical protein